MPAAARDRELARRPERVEHALGGRPLPVALARAAEVARGDLAALARRGHDLVRELPCAPAGSARTSDGTARSPACRAGSGARRPTAAGTPRAPSTRTPARCAAARRGRWPARGRSGSRARGAASGRRPRWSRSARSPAARCRPPARRGSPCAGAPRGAACATACRRAASSAISLRLSLGVGEPLEHVGAREHADRRVAVGDEHGRARLQVVVDVVQAPHRLHDGQRARSSARRSEPRAPRGRRASRGRAGCARARSRPPRRPRRSPGSCETAKRCRSAIASATGCSGATLRSAGTSPLRAATSSPAVGGRAVSSNMPCTSIQSSLKTFERYGRPPSGRITSTRLLGRQLGGDASAPRAGPCPPEAPIRMPSSRAMRRVAANDSRSETRIQRSTTSRSNVVGQKSSPTPSTRYECTCSLE